jgi:hypothetical protein
MFKNYNILILCIILSIIGSPYDAYIFSNRQVSPDSLLRPASARVMHNHSDAGFIIKDLVDFETNIESGLNQAEKILLETIAFNDTTGLTHDQIQAYIQAIKQFKAHDFRYEVLFKKTQALLNSGDPMVVEFARKSFIAIGRPLVEKKKGMQSKILGITGEVSGVYELVDKQDTCLTNIRIGDVKAINLIVKEKNTQTIIKEFDAASANSVFEFKFHLTLRKLYSQVIGLSRARISHLKVLSLPEFSHIRNLVYFGENEGGNTMKAALDFVEKHKLFDSITLNPTGSLSVKLNLDDFYKFIFDDKTLEYAGIERSSRIKEGFLDSKQAKNARTVLLDKISQIPKGEHFDVILGISNPAPEDLVRAKRLVQTTRLPKAEKHKITPQLNSAQNLLSQSA